MQNINPNQNNPGQNVPHTPDTQQYAVPEGMPFSEDEWKTLVNTPLRVSMAMMAISPSGPIGMVKESMAIDKSIQTLQQQKTISPLLGALGKQLTSNLQAMHAGKFNLPGTTPASAKDPVAAKTAALTACQQATKLLQKALPQDANAYKQFLYAFANNIAEASSEGGLLGVGGKKVSDAEKGLLNDLVSILGIQRS